MNRGARATGLSRRLVDALFSDAMLLADEARSYFDDTGRADRDGLDGAARVSFACESLKVTTRLMHVVAWLLTRRAVLAGELSERDAGHPARALGTSPAIDHAVLATLPERARALVLASDELFGRIARIEADMRRAARPASPVHDLRQRLEGAF